MVPNSPQIVVQGQFQRGVLHGHCPLGSARPSPLWAQALRARTPVPQGFRELRSSRRGARAWETPTGPEQEATRQEQNRFPSSAIISHLSNEDLFWVSPAHFPCRVVEFWPLNPAGGPGQRTGRGCCGEEGRSRFWGARATILEEEREGGGRCPRTSTPLGHSDNSLWDLHCPVWWPWTHRAGVTEELKFRFYLILINLT